MESFAEFNIALLVTMGTGVLLALFSHVFQDRFILSEPLMALLIGVAAGPFALDITGLHRLGSQPLHLLEQLARLTLAVAILHASLRVGWRWMAGNRRDMLLILLIGLPLMWGLSIVALEASLTVPAVGIVVLAAVVTPTDPVLAQAVVSSKVAETHVPANLRRLLSAESAANDGLSLLLVMIGIHLMTGGTDGLGAAVAWLIAWEIVAALGAGFAFGCLVGRLLRRFGSNWSTHAGIVAVAVTMAFATLAGAHLARMDGLFAVFGVALGLSATVPQDVEIQEEGFSHTLERLFYLPFLVLLGTMLPLDSWWRMGFPLAAAVLLLLTIRRLPMIFLLRPGLKTIGSAAEAAFAGWFGPIGIAAVFYATFAQRNGADETVFVVVSAAVAGSIAACGVTDTLGARWLGRALRRNGGRR